jgi:hypothetical protein
MGVKRASDASKKDSLGAKLAKFNIGDLLLIVAGVLVIMIAAAILRPDALGIQIKQLPKVPVPYYFDFFVRSTAFRFLFFALIPLLIIWIAKLFAKKQWNFKKFAGWAVIGVAVMLLIYFIAPVRTGFENIKKSAVPDVKLFVMSFCPYGQQAETDLKPVQDLLGEKAVIEPHFIINDLSYTNTTQSGCILNNSLCSLHGVNELYEDMRQICIWREYREKWWDYAFCINNGCTVENVETCWASCAEKYDISVAKIRACQKEDGIEIAKENRDLSDALKAYGSPSFYVNNASYEGTERTSEILKTAICKGFLKQPPECGMKLQQPSLVTETQQPAGNSSNKSRSYEEGFCPRLNEKTGNRTIEEGICLATNEKSVSVNVSR